MNPWQLLDHLTIKKTPWNNLTDEEKKSVSAFQLNRYLSMSDDFLILIDEIQGSILRMKPEMAYNTYLEILPKKKLYIKYVKNNSKEKIPKELIDIFYNFFQLGKEEISDYIIRYTDEDIDEILTFYGYPEKDRKNFIKKIVRE
jgi:hypothetical protein